MNIFYKIKEFAGNHYLNKHLPKNHRFRKIVNLDNAKTLGIIYELKDELTYNHINRFIKFLQDKQINVKAIGYFDGNIRPIYAIEKLSLDYYDRKDLNWYAKPKGNYVADFIQTDFDILIDLSLNNIFQTKYIAAMSKAKFKVGKDGENNKVIFDLMIDINPNTTLDEFITLIIHYLSIINKKDNEEST
ncbi:MAG: hypothetical protein HXX18_08120 [Bacteroidetes bacterium]|nr:hypothetical protein [Bacteroidota bacterium]